MLLWDRQFPGGLTIGELDLKMCPLRAHMAVQRLKSKKVEA